jgi:predicted type IV restriction endonuclease
MSDAFEEGHRNIEALQEFYKGQKLIRNEATTRIQLIDRLFFECLGWTRDDMYSEESQDGDYADYTFLAPRRILIVEAKKEGTTFEFPVAAKPQLKRSLKTLLHLGAS